MSKEKRALCKWSKSDIRDNIRKLGTIVSEPQYVCGKCARAANEEEYLCKPEKLKK